jgi:hypothetical protein
MTEKYLLLINEDPTIFDGWSKERWAQHDERHREFNDAVKAAGAKVLASEPLDVAPVRFRPDANGEVLVTDGPFTESKEIVLGFYLLEVADDAQARELAALCPTVGYLELRRSWLGDPDRG